jgi:hypothetical protein
MSAPQTWYFSCLATVRIGARKLPGDPPHAAQYLTALFLIVYEHFYNFEIGYKSPESLTLGSTQESSCP